MKGRKRHINEFLRTGLTRGGRVAGHGMAYDTYDRYGDEDFPDRDHSQRSVKVRLPSDYLTNKEKEALSSQVITYFLEVRECGEEEERVRSIPRGQTLGDGRP